MSKRRTRARVAIAVELLHGGQTVHWGYELSRNAGVSAGSMYPFLGELLEAGYVTDEWEQLSEAAGRPPRRCYRVTEAGRRYLADFVGGAPTPVARAAARQLRPGVAES